LAPGADYARHGISSQYNIIWPRKYKYMICPRHAVCTHAVPLVA